MKFMKLGSKPNLFQADGDNVRYVAAELATDMVVNVGEVKFCLHKFPILSKSAYLQKLVATTSDDKSNEIHVRGIPGGPAAFEMCAKFCYGMTVTLNAYNVVAVRCAAEYLEMYETIEKGNLIYKIEVFLNSSIFHGWKDSIIVLQTTESFLPWSEELKLVSRCLDSIASKACIDTSKVEWSYTYDRKKLPSENGKDLPWNGLRKSQTVPKDWWVEDLCELPVDLYKKVITTIITKGRAPVHIIGEALHAYALRRLPGFSEGMVQSDDITKCRSLAETILWLLPTEKGSVPCGFMLKLLRATILLECGDIERNELMRRISQQLEEATVSELLIPAPAAEAIMYDVDIVQSLVEEFVKHERNARTNFTLENEFLESKSPKFGSDDPKVQVAKLVEGYLAEISRDPSLPVSKFVSIADMVSSFPRPSHDGLYYALDVYLKEHPGISKSERKRICRLMDCRKLSADACMHVMQNERLPLRVIVQLLFFEQVRQATPSGNEAGGLPGSIRAFLPSGSHGSSTSTTTNTEDWDTMRMAEDINALRGELATSQLGSMGSDRNLNEGAKNDTKSTAANKMKGSLVSKIFSKLWSNKERDVEISSSDTSESPGSVIAEEKESTPSRRRR